MIVNLVVRMNKTSLLILTIWLNICWSKLQCNGELVLFLVRFNIMCVGCAAHFLRF